MEAPTEKQILVAKALGVDIADVSRIVAATRLYASVVEAITVPRALRPTTEAQRVLGRKLRLRGLSQNSVTAAAQISAEFALRNQRALEKYRFCAGMPVRFVGGPHVHQLNHQIGALFVVSSVHPDGRIFFKGTTGFSAYASQLRPRGRLRSDFGS